MAATKVYETLPRCSNSTGVFDRDFRKPGAQMNPISFEIPQQSRQIMEQNVRQLNDAYFKITDSMTSAMSAWFGALPENAMTNSVKAVQEKTTEFARHNAEAAFAHAKEVAKAKTLQEIFALQSKYAQQQFQSFTSQTQELAKLASSVAQSVQKGS